MVIIRALSIRASSIYTTITLHTLEAHRDSQWPFLTACHWARSGRSVESRPLWLPPRGGARWRPPAGPVQALHLATHRSSSSCTPRLIKVPTVTQAGVRFTCTTAMKMSGVVSPWLSGAYNTRHFSFVTACHMRMRTETNYVMCLLS